MNERNDTDTIVILKSLLDRFQAMSWLADASAARIYFNGAWLGFTGRDPRSEVGFGWQKGVHPADADCCAAEYMSAFKARAPFCCKYRLKNGAGEFITVTDSGWPFDDNNGNFMGYLGFCTAGGAAAATDGAEKSGASRRTADAGVSARSYSILVAEDNPINYMLVAELLKKLGHRPSKAENGKEAVEIAARGGFDIIFMDLQMPLLDGYEAAREIRRRGVGTPIVAITAGAIRGDYEKCLDVGMNDYITKPIDVEKFNEVIERNAACRSAPCVPQSDLPPRHAAAAAPKPSFPPAEPDRKPAAPAFDREKFVRTTFGNDSLARNILKILFDDLDKYMASIRGAIAAGDAETVFKSAHRLKGSALNVCAERLRAAFLALEAAGRESRLGDAAAIAREIDDEIAAFKYEIQKYGY